MQTDAMETAPDEAAPRPVHPIWWGLAAAPLIGLAAYALLGSFASLAEELPVTREELDRWGASEVLVWIDATDAISSAPLQKEIHFTHLDEVRPWIAQLRLQQKLTARSILSGN